VEVRFQRSAGLPGISLARDFVQQVLLNFIFNAAEAMTDRKQIALTTRLVEAPPSGIILSPVHGGRCVAIAVKDSGSGIAPENLSRIFEPFFTTKAMSARRGTGLGLSMVYELAKKLEAGLSVETVVGEGSTFTIFLPVKPDQTRLVQAEIEMRR
jgi:signal transduction histidine kinase